MFLSKTTPLLRNLGLFGMAATVNGLIVAPVFKDAAEREAVRNQEKAKETAEQAPAQPVRTNRR